MKPFIKFEGVRRYNGEYFHNVVSVGIEYTEAMFSDDDWYKQVTINFLIISICFGIESNY